MEGGGGFLQVPAAGTGGYSPEGSRGGHAGFRISIEASASPGVHPGAVWDPPFLSLGIRSRRTDERTLPGRKGAEVGRIEDRHGGIWGGQSDGHRGISGAETAARFSIGATERSSTGPRYSKEGNHSNQSHDDKAIYRGLSSG